MKFAKKIPLLKKIKIKIWRKITEMHSTLLTAVTKSSKPYMIILQTIVKLQNLVFSYCYLFASPLISRDVVEQLSWMVTSMVVTKLSLDNSASAPYGF